MCVASLSLDFGPDQGPDQFTRDYKRGCNPVHCCNTCHGAVDSFTVESLIIG